MASGLLKRPQERSEMGRPFGKNKNKYKRRRERERAYHTAGVTAVEVHVVIDIARASLGFDVLAVSGAS